jgi:adenosine deaminase
VTICSLVDKPLHNEYDAIVSILNKNPDDWDILLKSALERSYFPDRIKTAMFAKVNRMSDYRKVGGPDYGDKSSLIYEFDCPCA